MNTHPENRFPAGWDEERVRRVLEHYEGQSEGEAAAEDEAAFEAPAGSLKEVSPAPSRLPAPGVRLLPRG